MRKALALLLLVSLLGLLAACGSDDDEPEPEAAAPTEATDTGAEETDACAMDQLNLVSDGTLTIGTDNPAFPPWFQDAEGAPWDPTTEPTKMGYEAAVAYAVAEELGFSEDAVQWVVVPFDRVVPPGPEGLRLRHQPDLIPARARPGRRLQRLVLRRRAGGRRPQELRVRRTRRPSRISPARSWAPRWGRRATRRS